MQLTLRKHQWDIVQWIVSKPRCAIWASMGSGKTASVLAAIGFLNLVRESSTLVIAPLRVATTTWIQEARKWEDFKKIKIVPIVGSAPQRQQALLQKADIYTINYENIPWLVKECGENWPFAMIVADESTRLKSFRANRGSRQAGTLAKIAWSKVEHFIELTGTPSPNGLIDLWGQLWFLDRGERLGRTFSIFTKRWFLTLKVGAHAGAVRYKPRDSAQREIEKTLKEVCLSIDVADTLDLKEPLHNTVPVELPEKVMASYKTLEVEKIRCHAYWTTTYQG